MLDVYLQMMDGTATDKEIELANSQLQQILKNLGCSTLNCIDICYYYYYQNNNRF